MEREKIEIYESKVKNIGLGVTSFIFFLIAVWWTFNEATFNTFKDVFLTVLLIFSGLFFAVGSVLILKQAFNSKPVIVIDTNGFTNFKSGKSKGQRKILWDEVEEISIENILSENFVCVHLKDEEAYLETMSRGERMGAKGNIKLGFPAISISANSFKNYNNNELYQAFSEMYHQYLHNKEIS